MAEMQGIQTDRATLDRFMDSISECWRPPTDSPVISFHIEPDKWLDFTTEDGQTFRMSWHYKTLQVNGQNVV